MVFDEGLMLREKSEMKDKAQGGASNSLTTLRKKKLSSQKALKGLKDQKRTPHIQMETTRWLLKSNADR